MGRIGIIYDNNMVTLLLLFNVFAIVDGRLINVTVVDAVHLRPNLWPITDADHHRITLRALTSADGLLLVAHNYLDTQRRSCSHWRSILELVSSDQRISLGCNHYLAHYFESPLILSLIPSIVATALANGDLSITLTAVHFGCRRYQDAPMLRACPNRPHLCIDARLFCDERDNCGLFADEIGCGGTTPSSTMVISIVDDRSLMSPNIMLIVLTIAGITTLLLVVITVTLVVRNRRNANSDASAAKYPTKSLHHMLGLRSSKPAASHTNVASDSTAAEETVALLSWGVHQHLRSALLSPYRRVSQVL